SGSSGPSLLISATDTAYSFDVAGAVSVSENVGIGASFAVNNVTRDTEAGIGHDGNADDSTATISIAGAAEIDATNSHYIGTFAVSGSKASSKPGEDPSKSSNPQTGMSQPSTENGKSTGTTNSNSSGADDPGKLPNNQSSYDAVIAELKQKFGESSGSGSG